MDRPGAVILPLLLVGCGAEAPLVALHAGCVDVADTCEIVPGTPLRVWVEAAADAVEAPAGATREAVAGGTRLTWSDPTPGTFTVRVGRAVARLHLSLPSERPWEAALREATPEDCRHLADLRLPTLTDPTERASTAWVAAGCDLRAGARDAAVARMETAAVAFDAAGRRFEATRARCALSSVLFGAEGALPRVRALLAVVPEDDPNGELVWGVAWHRALLHRRTGNYRAAADALDRAEEVALRLGLDAEVATTREQRAILAAELGRPGEAAEVQRQLVASTPLGGDCSADARAAARRTALAWSLLLEARASRRAPPAEVDGLLDTAAEIHRRCAHPARDRANVEVNRALAALLAGNPDAARRGLAAAAAAQPGGDPLYDAWVAEIDARVALVEGDFAAAEASFDRAIVYARLRGAPEAQAHALDGRATARWAAGRRVEALEDWGEAQAAVWAGAGMVPIDAGAAAFLSSREDLAARHVAALVEEGRAAEAFAVARAARSHLLRVGNVGARLEALDPDAQARWDEAVTRYRVLRVGLDAAAAGAWALSAADLAARQEALAADERAARRALDAAMAVLGEAPPAPPGPAAPGDLLLLWLPTEGGILGFAADERGVEVARSVSDADLLAPFAAAIRRARRVVLLPWGSLRERDLHTLPFDGAPLLARVPVVWSLDLGPPPRRTAARRLLVADPTSDLPGARAEAEVIRAAWAEAVELRGPGAGVAAVRAAVAEADVFHYAGHATFREGRVWEAGLSLADGTLRVGDVLALPRVPDTVVLSACGSGRTETAQVEGWGLAQAFVARGASVVLATSRPVSDRTAEHLARALYADPDLPLSAAARDALLGLRAEGADDWAAFRVWVPG